VANTPSPPREVLVRKLESLHPYALEPATALEPEDVTGVIDLALERVTIAQSQTAEAMRTAVERFEREAAAAKRVTRVLSESERPPPR
jgi:hypothetical protein